MALLPAGVVTVTGAASGMGQQAALAFARDGAVGLVLGDVDTQGLETTRQLVQKQSPSVEVVTMKLDVSNEESVQAFVDLAVAKFGRIDYAINAAGVATPMLKFVDSQGPALNRCIAVNTKGIFLCSRAQALQMKKQVVGPGVQCRGSIINITSLAGHGGAYQHLPAYTGSKSAAEGLTRALAQEVGPDQIRVNAVAPGFTFTPMLRSHAGVEDMDYVASITPLRRLGLPEDIANTCVLLCSPLAGFITGQALAVDGGMSLEHYC